MTIGSMCSGDILTKYEKSEGSFGRNATMTPAGQVEGNLQYLSTKAAMEYGAASQERVCEVYFDEPHGMNENFAFMHTSRADGSAVTPRLFQVLSTYEEGPPGRTLLYVVVGREITGRGLTIL